jgi:hypothetical protein
MSVQNKVRELIAQYEKLTDEHGFDFVTSELVIQFGESIDRRGTDAHSYISNVLRRGIGSLRHSSCAGSTVGIGNGDRNAGFTI